MTRPTPFDRHFCRDAHIRLDEEVWPLPNELQLSIATVQIKLLRRDLRAVRADEAWWQRFAAVMAACFIGCAVTVLCMAVGR